MASQRTPSPWSINIDVADDETKQQAIPANNNVQPAGNNVKVALARALQAKGFLAATPGRKEQPVAVPRNT